MGKWLSRFLAEHQEAGPDIPDIVTSVSGLSGSDFRKTMENRDRDADLWGPPRPSDNISTPGMEPTNPLQPGWLILYRAPDGQLWGGPSDRERGTVTNTEYAPAGFQVRLRNGLSLSLPGLRAVSISDEIQRWWRLERLWPVGSTDKREASQANGPNYRALRANGQDTLSDEGRSSNV